MSAELSAEQLRFVASVPMASRVRAKRSLRGELSPRQAIRAHCLSCSGFVRAEAKACQVVLCALLPLNPWKAGDEVAA